MKGQQWTIHFPRAPWTWKAGPGVVGVKAGVEEGAEKTGGQDRVRQAKTKGKSGKGLERAEPGLRERQLKKEACSHRKDLTFSHVGWRSGEGSREEAWLPEVLRGPFGFQ